MDDDDIAARRRVHGFSRDFTQFLFCFWQELVNLLGVCFMTSRLW